MKARAVFLDRDGVITKLVPDPITGRPESPLDPADVALLPGAATALRVLRATGLVLVVVSNQPAAAKRVTSLERLGAVHSRFVGLLAEAAAMVDDVRYCRHHPDGQGVLGRACNCRKPAPGMLTAAAAAFDLDLEQSWMIGDTDTDVAAGLAVRCRTVLVETEGSAHKRAGSVPPIVRRAPDLVAAAHIVLNEENR